MIAFRSFLFFSLERMRCVLLALATIVLVKIAAMLVLAPMLDAQPLPGTSTAATLPLESR